jgi:hypothetical protein
MVKFQWLFILSILGYLVNASNLRQEDSDEERRENKSKRSRREILPLTGDVFGIDRMTFVLSTTGLAAVDPTMMEFYNRIVVMTDREKSAVVDEAFQFFKFEELKYLHKLEILNGNVTEDYLTLLCQSINPVSFDILKYLLDNEIDVSIVKKSLLNCLMTCSLTNFEKFKMFWIKFEGHLLPKSSIANILFVIVNNRMDQAYDLVMSSFEESSAVKEILGQSLSSTVINKSSFEALNFFMSKSIPFKNYLALNSRISILNLAAQFCNLQLTEYVLKEENIKDQLMKTKRPPWIDAIQNDCPTILKVYIENILEISIFDLVKISMMLDKKGVIDYLKNLGYFDQCILMMIAKTGIDADYLEIVEKCIEHGLDVNGVFIEDDVNIFNYAVMRNTLNIVKLFLNNCNVDINRVYERRKESNVEFFTSLYFVRTKEMVTVFYSHGADLNFIHTILNSHGSVVQSGTKMSFAAKAFQVGVYQKLLDCGANPMIPNESGNLAGEILDEYNDLYY